MKWRGRKGNNLHRRCAQDGSTLSSLPLRKIPRSSPSLPATLSSFGHFYHGYHNYSTRSRSNITQTSFTYDIVYTLCHCLRFMYTIFLSITCCSDLSLFVFLKLYFRMAAHG